MGDVNVEPAYGIDDVHETGGVCDQDVVDANTERAAHRVHRCMGPVEQRQRETSWRSGGALDQ